MNILYGLNKTRAESTIDDLQTKITELYYKHFPNSTVEFSKPPAFNQRNTDNEFFVHFYLASDKHDNFGGYWSNDPFQFKAFISDNADGTFEYKVNSNFMYAIPSGENRWLAQESIRVPSLSAKSLKENALLNRLDKWFNDITNMAIRIWNDDRVLDDHKQKWHDNVIDA